MENNSQLSTLHSQLIKAVIVDDHKLFRMGLKAAFQIDHPDICITGEAKCGNDVFDLLAATPADIVLLDVNLPDVGGADVARRLRREYPCIKILVISGENSAEAVEAMLETGINGFISKHSGDSNELAEAIRTIVSGLEYFGRDISAILYGVYVSKKQNTAVTNEFTEREKEIILACRDGLLCKEIAERLRISTHTVNAHKNNIFKKLGINNTMEMVQYALKKGIIRVENGR
jgi:DNA-binding NarL/FixJ family response regulator